MCAIAQTSDGIPMAKSGEKISKQIDDVIDSILDRQCGQVKKCKQITEESLKDVRRMAAMGMEIKAISRLSGIALGTLEKHCRVLIAEGREAANLVVMKKVFTMVLSGKHPKLAESFMNNRCGWNIEASLDISGKTDQNVKVNITNLDPIEAAKVYQKIMGE